MTAFESVRTADVPMPWEMVREDPSAAYPGAGNQPRDLMLKTR